MKKLLFLLAISFLLSQVSALYLLEPIAQEVKGEMQIGAVMPDDILTLVFSKEHYDSIQANYPINYSITEKNIEIKIDFKNTKPNTLKRIEFSFIDFEKPLETNKIIFIIPIQDNLITIEPLENTSLYKEEEHGNLLIYYLKAENKSLAENTFSIHSELPNRELLTKEITLKPLTSKTYEIIINPISPRYASFTLNFSSNNFNKQFKASYLSKPNLKSEFSLVKAGFPISSILLFPYYSFFSLFQ